MWEINIIGFEFYFIFYIFIIYSFFGWIYESGFKSLQKKIWVNRGFLNGPIIPIYGAGATVVYITTYYIREDNLLVFLVGMLLATLLEYFTSLIMEKIFHTKWWDYSTLKFNLSGRICLTASLLWGLFSVLMANFLQPLVDKLISFMSRESGIIVGNVIIVIGIVDITVTSIYAFNLDKKLSRMQKLREEFYDYIETTRLYDITGDVKKRFDQSQLFEWAGIFREKVNENIKNIENRYEIKQGIDEIEMGFKKFIAKYHKIVGRKLFVYKRLFKAFPNMQSVNKEYVLRDLKDKLFEKRKKNNWWGKKNE
jgi:uncharacterized membrane protein